MPVPVLDSDPNIALMQLIDAVKNTSEKNDLAELKVAYDQLIEKHKENLPKLALLRSNEVKKGY